MAHMEPPAGDLKPWWFGLTKKNTHGPARPGFQQLPLPGQALVSTSRSATALVAAVGYPGALAMGQNPSRTPSERDPIQPLK